MKKEFYEDVVKDVKKDFANRQNARRAYEDGWEVNMNFLAGNQYCTATPALGVINSADKEYYWQETGVFNHIAPIFETRVARLNSVRPKMVVRPSTSSQDDVACAEISTKILSGLSEKIELSKLVSLATSWSEVTGTAFYKVTWNGNLNKMKLKGRELNAGEVSVSVCSPFEVYPDDNTVSDISCCNSIIHAKRYTLAQVEDIYGKKVKPDSKAQYVSDRMYDTQRDETDRVTVIERYTLPTSNRPEGELAIVAGEELLYYGAMPYINGADGTRTFPFVQQVSQRQVGCVWGSSVIERLVPLQRSYNAVKNRKHEFLNRIASGVLAVEDGSVDTDNLEEEGLTPGKVLVYRQGSVKPTFLEESNVPNDFTYEEERLLNEFVIVSGVSELARNSQTPNSVTSGVALQLLVDQDDTRLSATAEFIRQAVKSIGKQALRLYKQFALTPRLTRTVGDKNNVETFYFNRSDISSDDIVFDTENELNNNIVSRRNTALQLLSLGVFNDELGRFSPTAKSKFLEIMGFGNWESISDLDTLQRQRAEKENVTMLFELLPVDDHSIHIERHTSYLLAEYDDLDNDFAEQLLQHIADHKQALAEMSKQSLGRALGLNDVEQDASKVEKGKETQDGKSNATIDEVNEKQKNKDDSLLPTSTNKTKQTEEAVAESDDSVAPF